MQELRLEVRMIDPGEFLLEFDPKRLRNLDRAFEVAPRGGAEVEFSGPSGAYWRFQSSRPDVVVTMTVEASDALPSNPYSWADSNATAAGFWRLEGFPAITFEPIGVTGVIRSFANPKRQIRLAALSGEEVQRLAEESPACSDELLAHVKDLPFPNQFVTYSISVNDRIWPWQVQSQIPALENFRGCMMQIYNAQGISVNWANSPNQRIYDSFGRDTASRQFIQAGGNSPVPDCNAMGFFSKSDGPPFVTYGGELGYGAGVQLQFYPNWQLYWAIGPADTGNLRTVINDTYFRDNGGYDQTATVMFYPAHLFFQGLLRSGQSS